MRLSDLSPATLAAIRKMRYDRIVEKHEGPETWDWQLNSQYPEVITRNERYKSMGSEWEPLEETTLFYISFTDKHRYSTLYPPNCRSRSCVLLRSCASGY